jgi:lysophospholipase L1-like esterase
MVETAAIFTKLFQNDTVTATNDGQPHERIWGVALGIAGDQTPNLLWRLENGELPPRLNPKVFVVLIGTNDLSRDYCSAENVIVGIIRNVEQLLRERPDATVVLHGLLPRTFNEEGYLNKASSDVGNGGGYLNNYFHSNKIDEKTARPSLWQDIQVINEELQGYALFRDRVEYWETNVFFQTPTATTTATTNSSPNSMRIDMDLMPDGLHPSAKGYELWGYELLSKLQEFMKKKSREKE